MSLFERLYDEQENAHVHFVGLSTDENRYDFGIVYTNMFFGKPLIVCMQTGKATLLGAEDVIHIEQLQRLFRIENFKDAEEIGDFFKEMLPQMSLEAQY